MPTKIIETTKEKMCLLEYNTLCPLTIKKMKLKTTKSTDRHLKKKNRVLGNADSLIYSHMYPDYIRNHTRIRHDEGSWQLKHLKICERQYSQPVCQQAGSLPA